VLETAGTRPLLHRTAGDGGMPTLYGHFAVWGDQPGGWARIESAYEGRFMESLARGAFARSIRERRDLIRVMFQHGGDPYIGEKALGPIQELREDQKGAGYVVPMLDTTYNRDLVPGLEAGLYGASFRFRTLREEFVDKPKASDHNPDGLPERTLKEVELFEFGPVVFGAYDGATAGVRGIREAAATVKRGKSSTVVTPVRRIELKNRAGRMVDVLIPGQTRFALDAEDVRIRPDLFRPVRSDDAQTRVALRRMQSRPGHTRARTSLAETLYGLTPRSRRVLPSRKETGHVRVLPRHGL
jgi:HK97 family phage prohead protease